MTNTPRPIDGDDEDDDEDEFVDAAVPAGSANYMTPTGYADLSAELDHLRRTERPKVVEVVSWAAGNGDRSENGDYIYGKKRLREIDRRIRYLTKRTKHALVIDPAKHTGKDQVFFSATVTFVTEEDVESKVTIVGTDEADYDVGKISWLSPVARALLKARLGDEVEIRAPSGRQSVEITEVQYL